MSRPTLAQLKQARANQSTWGGIHILHPGRGVAETVTAETLLEELIAATELLYQIHDLIQNYDHGRCDVCNDVSILIADNPPLQPGQEPGAFRGPSHREPAASMDTDAAGSPEVPADPGQRMEGTAAPPRKRDCLTCKPARLRSRLAAGMPLWCPNPRCDQRGREKEPRDGIRAFVESARRLVGGEPVAIVVGSRRARSTLDAALAHREPPAVVYDPTAPVETLYVIEMSALRRLLGYEGVEPEEPRDA